MKKKIGVKNLLYPMPVTVVGSMVNGRVNFANIAHVGILTVQTPHQPHLISLGMNKAHFSNSGIRETKVFSINMMSADQMIETDYTGIVSGDRIDKSHVFEVEYGVLKTAPMIKNSPISMECALYDTYETPNHDIFIGEIKASYAEESVFQNGKVDLQKVNPLLFDMSSVRYWSLGAPLGNCWSEGKKYKISTEEVK